MTAQQILTNRLIFIVSVIGFVAYFVQMYFTLSKKFAEGFLFLYSFNHYMSYFTIIINLSLSFLLFFYSVMPNSKISQWFKKATVNGAACLYILIVGIIYYALLAKDVHTVGAEFVVGHIMHAFMPLAYLYFWFSHFRTSSLRYIDGVRWLSFPFVYFVYLMIRGEIIGKYPYFFVDVAKFGVLMVTGFATVILLFFLLIGSVLIYIDRKFKVKSQ
jgi:hypothetical protein